MDDAFVVVNFIVDCVCKLVINIHCTCEDSVRINDIAERCYFFCSCLCPRSKKAIGCINCIVTFKLIGIPLLQTSVHKGSCKLSMDIPDTLYRLGKALTSKSWQCCCLTQKTTLARISVLSYWNYLAVKSLEVITYIWKGNFIGGRLLLDIIPCTRSTTSSALLSTSRMWTSLQERLLSAVDIWYCILSLNMLQLEPVQNWAYDGKQLTMFTWASCFCVAVCSNAIASILSAIFFCFSHKRMQINQCAYRSLPYYSIGP